MNLLLSPNYVDIFVQLDYNIISKNRNQTCQNQNMLSFFIRMIGGDIKINLVPVQNTRVQLVYFRCQKVPHLIRKQIHNLNRL